jgi:uncharacterized repeat protein (TIGR01451 family)
VTIVQNPHLAISKAASVPGGTADHAGEVISHTITVANDGNMTLTNPVVSDPSVSNLAYSSGDLDSDGKIDVGETWQYTASHTVTQDDIDNHPPTVSGPGTIHNTASITTHEGAGGSASADVPVDYDPALSITKAATVPGGTADTAGEVISYTINVANTGNVTLTTPVVNDPSVSNLAYASGDADNDGKIDVGETWQYTASHTVTQGDLDGNGGGDGTIDNTASASTDQGASGSASAHVPVAYNPEVDLTKSASVPGGTADTAGEVISYTIDVANTGNITLTGVSVNDPSVTDLAAVMSGGFNTGDANQDGKLDLGETWHYTASHTVTQTELNAGGTIGNTATVSTDQGASASDSASVTVVQPTIVAMTFDKSDAVGTVFVDNNENGHPDVGTDLIEWVLQVNNTGTVALHDIAIDDPLLGGSISGLPSTLAPGAFANVAINHFLTSSDVAAGHVFNSATATALDPSNNLITVMAHYDQLLPA